MHARVMFVVGLETTRAGPKDPDLILRVRRNTENSVPWFQSNVLEQSTPVHVAPCMQLVKRWHRSRFISLAEDESSCRWARELHCSD